MRAVAWQAGAVAATALAYGLAAGPRSALAAAVGGIAVVLGTWLSARLMLGGGVGAAGPALVRWFVGLMAKWLLVFAALGAGFGVWRLPPVPMLAGIVVALGAQVLAALRRAR
ncbi:MAG TPA: ATP synthase subunit I [Lysobacter sp.]|nr:ATP synthase subunit I [Lysobacter sp.]